MTLLKRYLFFFSIGLILQAEAKGQEIKGDTIYVDATAEIALRFPSMPTNRYTIPADAPYNFTSLGNGFTIKAKKKNTKSVPLFVTEDKRMHRFFIVYKKDINYNNLKETEYDYSTVKKLKEHVKQIEEKERYYNEAIAAADKSFLDKDYVSAKDQYTKALAIFSRTWPKDQLKKCNKKIRKGS